MATPSTSGDTAPSAWLSVDRIFGAEKEFRTESWGPAYWLKDGQAFTTLEPSEAFKDHPQAAEIKDIVRVDPATGERTVLVSARELLPPGAARPLELEKGHQMRVRPPYGGLTPWCSGGWTKAEIGGNLAFRHGHPLHLR